MIDKTVELVDLIGMHKTGCSGETRLVLHCLAYNELESSVTVIIYWYCYCYRYLLLLFFTTMITLIIYNIIIIL